MNVSISRNGTELGEWPEDQVRTLYKDGQLLPTDHYWKEGMTEWVELSKMIKPPPPAPAAKESDSTSAPQLSKATVDWLKTAKDEPPPAAGSISTTFRGIARLPYIGINLLVTLLAVILGTAFNSESAIIIDTLQFVVVMQLAMFARFVNIGHSGWLSLFALMPILSPFVNFYCWLAPAQYAIHKKRDAGMDLGLCIIGFIVLLIVVLLVADHL